MKRRALNLSILLVALLFGCAEDEATSPASSVDFTSNSSIDEQRPKTIYAELPATPTYEEVSEEALAGYRTFYFDSVFGDDSNNGSSANAPKKTLAGLPDIFATYGTSPLRLLLKRGSLFSENIVLGGYRASKDAPFIFDSYGEGELPVVEGNCSASEMLTNAVIKIQEPYTRISNIEVTGPTCTRGIYVLPRKSGVFQDIVISSCYVHDLNWNWRYDSLPEDTHPADIDPESVTPLRSVNRYRRLYGGIEIFNGTTNADESKKTGPIVFNRLFIINNRVENVSHVGINIYNYWVNRGGIGYGYNKFVEEDPDYQDFTTGVGYFPNTNVVVSGNVTSCIGGDGIIIDGTDYAYLEHNVSYKSSYLGRSGMFNAGIWLHNTRHGYFRYNEAAYTYLQNGAGDGQGFDIDNACEDIHFCYNYAHHNEGGGLLLCNNSSDVFVYDKTGALASSAPRRLKGIWRNNFARNNVFVHNGNTQKKERSAFITLARGCDDFIAENNTVALGQIPGQHIINCEDTVVSYGHSYKNNIFYSVNDNGAVFANHTIDKPLFDGNLYFQIADGKPLEGQLMLSDDRHAVLENPYLLIPNHVDGYETAKRVVPSVSIREKAQVLAEQLRFDLLGMDTSAGPYLGAISK